MIKQGKDLAKLGDIVDMLANGDKLPIANHDHGLTTTPRFRGCRECHVDPDWLLVYRIRKKELVLALVETGSHSALFGK